MLNLNQEVKTFFYYGLRMIVKSIGNIEYQFQHTLKYILASFELDDNFHQVVTFPNIGTDLTTCLINVVREYYGMPELDVVLNELHKPRNFWEKFDKNPLCTPEGVSHIRDVKVSASCSFFEQHLDKLDWYSLSININMKGNLDVSAFLERNLDKVNWIGLSTNVNVPVDFLEKHLDKISWSHLSSNDSIPTSFFEKHLDKIDWLYISGNPNIPVAVFQKYLDECHWLYLCKNPSIPVGFFQNHPDKIDWYYLSMNENIPTSFFERHLDKINWNNLCHNKSIGRQYKSSELLKLLEKVCKIVPEG